MKSLIVAASVLSLAVAAQAQMRITEFMYNGNGSGSVGEFVEFTNVGATAIDMTGWSFDDSSRSPGSQSLSAFGTVQPGQSVIVTDIDTAEAFRTLWNGLPNSVLIIPGSTNNLGRSDEINLYGPSPINGEDVIDRLTYNDQGTGAVKSPRTNGTSAWTELANLGLNDASLWHSSTMGEFGVMTSTAGEIASPGTYVPEPATLGLMALAGLGLVRRRPQAR